eukprot:gene8577-9493_t
MEVIIHHQPKIQNQSATSATASVPLSTIKPKDHGARWSHGPLDDSMDEMMNDNSISDHGSTDPKTLEEQQTELSSVENTFPKPRSEREQRMHVLSQNWSSARSYVFSCEIFKNSIPKPDSRCKDCGKRLQTNCISCRKILCVVCDKKLHSEFPFHDRKIWKSGYFESISNRQTLDEDDQLSYAERPLPVYYPDPCPKCQEHGTLSKICVDTIITIVTAKGL